VDFWWLLLPASYVLGSFPTARLVARTSGHDPTVEGSGNPGASNVYRVAGARAGLAVLTGDILKGFVPAAVALAAEGRTLALAVGLAAMVGHIAPFSRLGRGGKGVATLGGTTIALYPLVALACITIFGILLYRFKIPSVGSLAMLVMLPIGVAIGAWSWGEVAAVSAASVLVILRHGANIARLVRGREHVIS
jgi:glycerol-3-phosphate acyltransferase PlsY